MFVKYKRKCYSVKLQKKIASKGTPNAETTIVSIDINYGATLMWHGSY